MRKRPIGQILVEKNEISEAELAAALAEQERTGLRLGQILIETGRISWLALARAIAEQVLDIEDAQPEPTAPPASPVVRARSSGPLSCGGGCMVSDARTGGSPCSAPRSGGRPTSASCSGSSPCSAARSGCRGAAARACCAGADP
jgi:hypothetical protein